MKVSGGPVGTLPLGFVFLETLDQITRCITKMAQKESGWPVSAIVVIKCRHRKMDLGFTVLEMGKNAIWINCYLGRKRQWQPTSVLSPGKSQGRRSLVGCSPWGHEESDMTERLHFHFHVSEKEMATHCSIFAWRIPGMGEPGGLPSMGSHRVGHN